MDNKTILEQAIQKAIEGGFSEEVLDPTILGATGLIFRKDFATALWGKGKGVRQFDVVPEVDAWYYHLQQMVVADDPIKYLGENI